MTELGHNLAGPPPRAGHPASHPPGDTRPAPHSAPPGLRRADPLRTTKTTGRPGPQDPAACRAMLAPLPHSLPRKRGRVRVAACWVRVAPPSSRPSGAERACPGRDPGAGVRRGLPFNKIPHPEEAATAAVSEGPALAKAGDGTVPAPAANLPLRPSGGEGRGEVGVRPTRFVSRSRESRDSPPNAAATAPAPRSRGGAEHRPGSTPHPEN
jgi:hypothetical protein